MEINLWTCEYCLTRRWTQLRCTHSHKYTRPKRVWTNHTAVRRVVMYHCQGHECTLDRVRLWVCVQKLISINDKPIHISKVLFYFVMWRPSHCHVRLLSLLKPEIYTGDPRPCILPRVMASSARGSNWGSLGFLPTTHALKINASMIFVCRAAFMHVYLHTQTAADAGDIRTWRTTVILITGKTQRPPIWAPCWGWKWFMFWNLPCISVAQTL